MLLISLIPLFLRRLEAEGASKKTIHFYRYKLGKFGRICQKELEEVTADDVYEFLAQVRAGGASDYYVFNNWRAVMKFLKEHGVYLKVKPPKYVEKIPDANTREEIAALLAAALPHEKATLLFFILTGCREQEVQYAEWQDINWDARTFHVCSKSQWRFTPKSYESRLVPLPDSLIEALKPMRQERGLLFPNRDGRPNGHLIRLVQGVARRAGMNPSQFGLHKLRRTRVTHLHEAGVPVQDIKKWIGHTQASTTIFQYLAISDAKCDLTRRKVNLVSY